MPEPPNAPRRVRHSFAVSRDEFDRVEAERDQLRSALAELRDYVGRMEQELGRVQTRADSAHFDDVRVVDQEGDELHEEALKEVPLTPASKEER